MSRYTFAKWFKRAFAFLVPPKSKIESIKGACPVKDRTKEKGYHKRSGFIDAQGHKLSPMQLRMRQICGCDLNAAWPGKFD